MVTIRFAILLIPTLGLLALAGLAGESLAPILGGALKLGGIVLLPILGIVVLRRSRGYQSPRSEIRTRITGARLADGIGELMVEARHSSDVSLLRLPHGSRIRTVEANRLYAVTFQSGSRSKVEEIARVNGYQKKVG